MITKSNKVKKRNTWKQDDPRAQLVILIQSAWGHVHNVHNKISEIDKLEIALNNLKEAQEIIKQISSGEWDD